MTQFYSELVSATEDVDDSAKLEESNEDPHSSQGKDGRSSSADIVESHPGQSRSIQKNRQIAVLKAGQYFGERALLQNDVRGATGTVEDARSSFTISSRL